MSRLALLAGLAAFGLAGAFLVGGEAKPPPAKLVTHKVQREKLQPEIVERGSVESANSSEVVCRVKAGTGPNAVSSVIKWVIDEGEKVTKGQLLVELDAGPLEERLKAQESNRDLARQNLDQANDNLAAVKSQNDNDLEIAKVNLQLMELDLEKYVSPKGDAEQALQEIKGRLLLAEAEVEKEKDALEQAETKLKQNLATEALVRAARLRLEAARVTVERIQAERQSFEKYTRAREEARHRGTVAEARRTLARVQLQAKVSDTVGRQDVAAKKAVYDRENAHGKVLEAEIARCKMIAPQDGIAVYHVPEQVRGGSQAPIVAQGEPVREGQKLLSVVGLDKLQLLVRLPEAVVSQVRPGQEAVVRIDAFPGRVLRGKVSRVDPVASKRDRLRADVKVYPTVIALEGDTAGLKPGLSGTVSISAGKALDNVLTVPVQAVVRKDGTGKKPVCLVRTAKGFEEREVVAGLSNEKRVEIKSGLREGDEVVVNPQLLLNNNRPGGRTTTPRPK